MRPPATRGVSGVDAGSARAAGAATGAEAACRACHHRTPMYTGMPASSSTKPLAMMSLPEPVIAHTE